MDDSYWNNILSTIEKCSVCSGCDCGKKMVGGGDPKASVVFVSDCPANSDLASGKAFYGKAGKYLFRLLNNAGYKKGEVYLTYAIKCKVTSGAVVKDIADRCCLHLMRQIDTIRPKLIVALGSLAFSVLCPSIKKEVGSCRGSKVPSLGYTVMPTWHPGFVLSSYSDLRAEELQKDIKRSYRYAFYRESIEC